MFFFLLNVVKMEKLGDFVILDTFYEMSLYDLVLPTLIDLDSIISLSVCFRSSFPN